MAHIEIGELSFPSKVAATEHFRRMLHRNRTEKIIPEPDHSALCALLEKHPDRAEKIGVGVKGFSVRWAEYDTRCFEVIRQDGSREDFSFRWCIARCKSMA
jgi:hypothetical protein